MAVILAIVLAAMACPHSPVHTRGHSSRPGDYIRTGTDRIAGAIEHGYLRSATFRALADRIAAARALVYVDAGRCSAAVPPLDGCTAFLTESNGTAFVKIVVDVGGTDDRLIALLGHEMQHVLEITEAERTAGAHDPAAWRSRQRSSRLYETDEAEAAGRRIFEELRHATCMRR